ncbi:uncharacterized protein [Arachis hypogaea]|uniref:uncharacterized protein n=1 Tax=Arachis hypogaea TaxID=3818 RepID=UPI000786E59C|nr:uncharacterized protein LOC112803523 isoform X2 [Arachis hypogaea]XP_025702814.1 uncharacterized protein LOC112803523 isoform X2 [Arachis hypogaea]
MLRLLYFVNTELESSFLVPFVAVSALREQAEPGFWLIGDFGLSEKESVNAFGVMVCVLRHIRPSSTVLASHFLFFTDWRVYLAGIEPQEQQQLVVLMRRNRLTKRQKTLQLDLMSLICLHIQSTAEGQQCKDKHHNLKQVRVQEAQGDMGGRENNLMYWRGWPTIFSNLQLTKGRMPN